MSYLINNYEIRFRFSFELNQIAFGNNAIVSLSTEKKTRHKRNSSFFLELITISGNCSLDAHVYRINILKLVKSQYVIFITKYFHRSFISHTSKTLSFMKIYDYRRAQTLLAWGTECNNVYIRYIVYNLILFQLLVCSINLSDENIFYVTLIYYKCNIAIETSKFIYIILIYINKENKYIFYNLQKDKYQLFTSSECHFSLGRS